MAEPREVQSPKQREAKVVAPFFNGPDFEAAEKLFAFMVSQHGMSEALSHVGLDEPSFRAFVREWHNEVMQRGPTSIPMALGAAVSIGIIMERKRHDPEQPNLVVPTQAEQKRFGRIG